MWNNLKAIKVKCKKLKRSAMNLLVTGNCHENDLATFLYMWRLNSGVWFEDNSTMYKSKDNSINFIRHSFVHLIKE